MSAGRCPRGAVADDFSADDLERLVSGDKRLWDRFVARYAAVIYAAVRRKLVSAGAVDDTDDVVQDVFVRLCGRDFHLLRNYDPGRARLTTWLTVVSTSVSIDHLRRRKAPSSGLDEVPEAVLAVEDKRVEKIKIPPDLLSGRQALVVEMLYQREMDVSEAARALGIDPQTVRSTHHKALTKLRAHFRGREEDF